MSARPTIYLSNWSSHRTPGMYGPGVRYTIMGRPRRWERGAGTVNLLTPQGDEADLMARAVALRGTPEGEAAMRTYRDSLIAGWAVAVMKMRHPLLTAWSDREAFPVRDGDTLCCACSVAEARAGGGVVSRVVARIDPNPCWRYRWSEKPCPGVYSGSHICAYPGGHDGSCKCAYCDKRGRGKDRSDAYIPADDVILRGYCGPIRVFHPTVREWELTTYAWGRVIFGDCVVPANGLTMEMPWEEAQARDNAARVMAEGVRCPACKGTGKNGTLPAPDSPRDLPCYDCDGSGYLLPPADIDPLIDSNRGHRLTPAQSAVFVADAYTRWRRGLPIPSVVRCSGTPLPDSMTRHYCIAANGTVTTPDFPPEPK